MRKSSLLYIEENVSDLLMDEQIIGNSVYDMFDENVGWVAGLLVERNSCFPRYLVYIQGGYSVQEGRQYQYHRECFIHLSLERSKFQNPSNGWKTFLHPWYWKSYGRGGRTDFRLF